MKKLMVEDLRGEYALYRVYRGEELILELESDEFPLNGGITMDERVFYQMCDLESDLIYGIRLGDTDPETFLARDVAVRFEVFHSASGGYAFAMSREVPSLKAFMSELETSDPFAQNTDFDADEERDEVPVSEWIDSGIRGWRYDPTRCG